MNKVCIYDSLDALPAGYTALFEAAEQQDGIFLGLAWLQHLNAATFEPGTLRVYGLEPASANEAAGVQGALPMRVQARPSGWLSPQVMEAAANYYASLYAPLLAPSLPSAQQALTQIVRAAVKDTQADIMDLHPMALDSPMFAMSERALRAAGMVTQRYFCFGNWYLQVRGRSYQEYFASLPSRLRNTVQRKARQLESTGRLELRITAGTDGLDDAIRAYQQIYQSSWKGAESHPEFVSGLMRMLAAQGKLRLGVAYVDQQPAAAQLWIVSRRIASIYKLAYDEQFAELSIGSILTAHMMRHALDVDQVEQVDYLTGDETYKQDWMSDRRERWGLIAFRLRSARGLIAAARHIGGHALKQAMQNATRRVNKAAKTMLEK
ncbi:GNAT family N-acetyltransferase [Undibacterium sp.]|uniref:GNAT family N-acetyltransferase n=1 Tax=Undibacterium sp. TaxID=1914977 RepID=UPI00374D43AF